MERKKGGIRSCPSSIRGERDGSRCRGGKGKEDKRIGQSTHHHPQSFSRFIHLQPVRFQLLLDVSQQLRRIEFLLQPAATDRKAVLGGGGAEGEEGRVRGRRWERGAEGRDLAGDGGEELKKKEGGGSATRE